MYAKDNTETFPTSTFERFQVRASKKVLNMTNKEIFQPLCRWWCTQVTLDAAITQETNKHGHYICLEKSSMNHPARPWCWGLTLLILISVDINIFFVIGLWDRPRIMMRRLRIITHLHICKFSCIYLPLFQRNTYFPYLIKTCIFSALSMIICCFLVATEKGQQPSTATDNFRIFKTWA